MNTICWSTSTNIKMTHKEHINIEDEMKFKGNNEQNKRIDYVLVFPKSKDVQTKKPSSHEKYRNRFEELLRKEGFSIQHDTIEQLVYVKLHCPFKRLCTEAQRIQLKMPIKDCQIKPVDKGISRMIQNRFVTDTEGLQYLLMEKIYTDAFILHEDSKLCQEKDTCMDGNKYNSKTETDIEQNAKEIETKGNELLTFDPLSELDDTWTKVLKFQPLWKVRNYFGEKIALYFAWSGELITSLWIPIIFGLIIFIYGLVKSIEVSLNSTFNLPENATFTEEVTEAMVRVKQSFDNDAAPYFALVICAWGTIVLKLWKRKEGTLAYEWDVDEFEETESDRPQYYVKDDPITNGKVWYYPFEKQRLKSFVSASLVLFMICVVLGIVVGVIAYRITMNVEVCPNMELPGCIFLTTVVSSLLNAVFILVLQKLYDRMAVKLTDWENHQTETLYHDALIIKLFAFQFVNSYASCFYIAFVRERVDYSWLFGNSQYDRCSGTCMSQLSIQVLVLMIAKPFPKFLIDFIWPFLKQRWQHRPSFLRVKCPLWCRKNQVNQSSTNDAISSHFLEKKFLTNERLKPDLGDFTLSEYTEKVIMYGFLMLFGVSFSLAPLVALIVIWVDIHVDAKRMLWWYRRPVAFIAENIGMWSTILTFVNFVGILSHAFIIAFTSSWSENFSMQKKLWIVIIFVLILLVFKFILTYIISDVPASLQQRMRDDKKQYLQKLNIAEVNHQSVKFQKPKLK
ncbi:anoctamin-7-like isoform X2 [Gigantopelta aegis]|uniref:anoctamin-7-like isoform X2 n=1 Tax=Gigantopelta aegis TaxID=1735272 RepID=UPI001B88A084|nr:anoctamin-7-like isoform X2 [Gigantopelta aegis]